MRFLRGPSKVSALPDTGAAIRLGEFSSLAREANPAGFLLVVFMRLLAVLWALQGLLQWGAILLPPEPLFDKVSTLNSAAIIFFAVFDLVAAVGLWLAAPWGGVIWLLGAITQIAVSLWLPEFYSRLWIALDLILITLYFGLTWQASQRVSLFLPSSRR